MPREFKKPAKSGGGGATSTSPRKVDVTVLLLLLLLLLLSRALGVGRWVLGAGRRAPLQSEGKRKEEDGHGRDDDVRTYADCSCSRTTPNNNDITTTNNNGEDNAPR